MQLSSIPPPEAPQSGLHAFDPLLLPQTPTATSIILQLEAIGLSTTIAQQASNAYLTIAYELRDACESSYRNALQRASAKRHVTDEEVQALNKVWSIFHAQQMNAWAERTFSRARDAVRQANTDPAAQYTETKKPVFNHEYTPLLEKYFEYNAYPSAADRAVLARKSMMTPRQIEVWFQNHRNRGRKDGKPLRKLAEDPLPLELSLKSLERKMPFFTVPEHERKPAKKLKDDSLDEDDTASITTPSRTFAASNVLNPPRPCHAFPTLYPPRCDYDPFPAKVGNYKFPPPVWIRKPATSRRIIKTLTNMDDFIEDFSTKLHLRVPASQTSRSKRAQSWCASRAIVLPSAPHPSLFRSAKPLPLRYTSRLPTVPPCPPRLHPFRSPSPLSQPATLIPPQQPNDIPSRRKVARLPRRTPKDASIARRRGSPAISEASPAPSRSSSSTSRSSSFGSEASSERRPSSSSGSSSSSSSALPTPVLSHSELPDEGHSPVSVSGPDFENIDGLASARRQIFSPTPFNFSMTGQPKQAVAFGFSFPSAGALGIFHSTVCSYTSPS